jgi:hypothetical protein
LIGRNFLLDTVKESSTDNCYSDQQVAKVRDFLYDIAEMEYEKFKKGEDEKRSR